MARRHNRVWLKAEIALLHELYPEASWPTLRGRLGRTTAAIRGKAASEGIRREVRPKAQAIRDIPDSLLSDYRELRYAGYSASEARAILKIPVDKDQRTDE